MKLDSCVIYEGFARRLLAGLVDATLVLVIGGTLFLLGVVADAGPSRASTLIGELSGSWAHALWLLAVIFSAQAVFWTTVAATPGMLLIGSQVLNAKTGRKLSLARSCVRCLGLWLGLACLGVGVLWSIRDPRHQGLHDKLAGSVVVTEDESQMTLEELAEGLK